MSLRFSSKKKEKLFRFLKNMTANYARAKGAKKVVSAYRMQEQKEQRELLVRIDPGLS